MKKLLLLTGVLILTFGGTLFAQEADTEFRFYNQYPWALGGSFELGRNARADAATGFGVSLDRYMFTRYVALGLRGAMHTDGNGISATEALFNVRAYAPLRSSNAAMFAQWGFGYAYYTEEGRERNTYTMDMLAGCRIYINRTVLRGFYIEPYFRAGYPFLLGGGLALGHRFNF